MARVRGGESLRRICAEKGYPHRTTLTGWRRAHPEFDLALDAAHLEKRVSERMRDRQVMAAAAVAAAGRAAQRAAALASGGPLPRGGKASAYTPELGEVICARLANGESLTSIGADPAMPAYVTILGWVKRNAEFQEMYVEARATHGDFLFDEARDVALGADRDTLPLARLQFDVIRWQAARLAPKKYAEQLVVGEALVAARAKVAEAAEARAEAARAKAAAEKGAKRTLNVRVTHFEVGPGKRVLAAPPRTPAEAEAWVEATGRPYEPGVGPNGEIRPPPLAWMAGGSDGAETGG